MKNVLAYVLEKIVEHPEDVQVEETLHEQRSILTIKVHPDDMGKVIGKQGRIIRALRDIIKLIAAKHNSYVDVVVAE